MEIVKKIREYKAWFKPILMCICSVFLVIHCYQFAELLEYEEVPAYVPLNNGNQLEPVNNINYNFNLNTTGLLINNSFIKEPKKVETETKKVDVGNQLLFNDSNYDANSNMYNLDFNRESQRDVKLINVIFDLFLIALLWHSKVKKDEED